MGESELVISLDENSETYVVPDNTRIQRNLLDLQTHIFYKKMSNQFIMSTNRNMVGDRPDCLVGSDAMSGNQDQSQKRYGANHASAKLDEEEICPSINEEELFGEGDKLKVDPVDREDNGNENGNDISDGQCKDKDKRSSKQRDPRYTDPYLSQTSVSSEQNISVQRRRRFKDFKDQEVIKDSIHWDNILETLPNATGIEQSNSMPDIIKSSSGSSLSSFVVSAIQQQSPDVLNVLDGDVFNKFSDEPDGLCPEKVKEKLEKKILIEGKSHYPEEMTTFSIEPSAVQYPSSLSGQNGESPAHNKRGRFKSSGYGTDSKQSQNSQNSMESSAFDGSFEKNDPSVINRKDSKVTKQQIDSAFSEEMPNLSIFNFTDFSHDSPPNDSESLHGNLPDIETLLEMRHCHDGNAVVTNSVSPHPIDESVAVTNSVIQHVNQGDPKDMELLKVQQNYCLPSPEENPSNSFKPTLDANEVLTQHIEKKKMPSREPSVELPSSCNLENLQLQHDMALLRHDLFVAQDDINSAKYEQYLQDFPTPSPVGENQSSPYEKSLRSTPVPLAELTPQITRADLEYSSRCKDKHCMDESCRKIFKIMAYRDHDPIPTELSLDLCKALQDHCVICSEPKCSVMFCSSFAKQCQQSFEFETLMNHLYCLIKDPLCFLNLQKEETQIVGKLPNLLEDLVVPLVTVSGEFGSPVLARLMLPEHPQLLVVKEIPHILDCDQNITVYKQLMNLTHPHIVSHYWIKEYIDNSMHIFMEFIQGDSLSTYLDTVERLTWENAAYYCRQLVEAVFFLHQRNIVYLYWDAGNILFTDCSYSCVKLCNLTMSCPVDQQQDKFDSNGTKLSLPPHLCPPELGIRSQVDKKSDCWGVGCLMIEMLTGKPIWHDKRHETKASLLQLVCHQEPSIPSHLKEEQKFLRGCLQINIEDRWSFQQVKDFLKQLHI